MYVWDWDGCFGVWVSELGAWVSDLGARAAGPLVAWDGICEPLVVCGLLHAPLVVWGGICEPLVV